MKYILLTDQEKEIVNKFNTNGYYLSIICSTKWGDVIVDNLDDAGYEDLKQQLINSKRFEVDENGRIVSGLVPEEVPLWCLRTVLKIIGLFTQVQTAINALPETNLDEIQFKTAAMEGWEYSNTVARKGRTTLLIQQLLQLSDPQVDTIFEQANSIDA